MRIWLINTKVIAVFYLLSCSYSSASTEWSPKMEFSNAMDGYVSEKYVFDGYVGKDGKVKNGGLGCSGFVSVVLHRMKYGEDWKKHYTYTVHQQYGDKIAVLMDLKKATKIGSPSFFLGSEKSVKLQIQAGHIIPSKLYFFDLRLGKHGHVGFVKFSKDGSSSQTHYSGIKGYQGLAKGSFSVWLKKSKYKASNAKCTLYTVPD